jgi:hypothetical protein
MTPEAKGPVVGWRWADALRALHRHGLSYEIQPEGVRAALAAAAAVNRNPALDDFMVVTHGRHCPCSACGRQDWAEPGLAPCGMHGPSCPPVYAPVSLG